ncbi:MAG TPA: hypothetical protein VHD69_03140 [Candidatus Paceibacterota bacterium]|jgi:hypothetical protein|nr:hypothetical protein [Candidatus Paceibacterota bacterium]
MDTLSLLFGSTLRLKMLRLFLLNPEGIFDIDNLTTKMSVKARAIETETAFLKKLGLVKSSKVMKRVEIKKGKKLIAKKVRMSAWTLDERFKYRDALSDFLTRIHPVEHKAIVKRLERAGRIKAVVVSGIFTGQPESRLDMFVVGDNVKNSSMDRIVRGIESDMGKDIRYVVVSGPDYAYRVSMNDKLVRDVIDFPHTILLDKIGISR